MSLSLLDGEVPWEPREANAATASLINPSSIALRAKSAAPQTLIRPRPTMLIIFSTKPDRLHSSIRFFLPGFQGQIFGEPSPELSNPDQDRACSMTQHLHGFPINVVVYRRWCSRGLYPYWRLRRLVCHIYPYWRLRRLDRDAKLLKHTTHNIEIWLSRGNHT